MECPAASEALTSTLSDPLLFQPSRVCGPAILVNRALAIPGLSGETELRSHRTKCAYCFGIHAVRRTIEGFLQNLMSSENRKVVADGCAKRSMTQGKVPR
jgi:hypothetical protein